MGQPDRIRRRGLVERRREEWEREKKKERGREHGSQGRVARAWASELWGERTERERLEEPGGGESPLQEQVGTRPCSEPLGLGRTPPYLWMKQTPGGCNTRWALCEREDRAGCVAEKRPSSVLRAGSFQRAGDQETRCRPALASWLEEGAASTQCFLFCLQGVSSPDISSCRVPPSSNIL